MPLRALWSLAPSTLVPGVIWTGATNGVIQVSRDHGRTWTDVSIRGIQIARARSARGRSVPARRGTAYAALDLHFRATFGPIRLSPHDYGKTWTKIVTGLPAELRAARTCARVRADLKRRGLLFRGHESGSRLARRR